ncbi:MAG TPA: AEC family transporter [Gammaproteobacteria bacterium]|nr:AEC family transporter [Gammaproteobacteria bacterium]
MYQAIGSAAFLIVSGVLWRLFRPLGSDADQMRLALTSLVYVFLLPALVLLVLWRAPLGMDAVRLALISASCIVAGLVLSWIWFRGRGAAGRTLGTVLLAAGWGNFTYLGLPVLEGALGPWARAVAIQFDLFAATPLLLSLGIILASRYGTREASVSVLRELLKVPPIWAALAGVVLNYLRVPLGRWLEQLLEMLAAGVVPLMLFSTGLALRWVTGWRKRLAIVLPVVTIRLLLAPSLVLLLAIGLGLGKDLRTAVVLEAAMPSMVLGLVICDRFGLETSLYAEIVVISTAIAALTLPFWFLLLS